MGQEVGAAWRNRFTQRGSEQKDKKKRFLNKEGTEKATRGIEYFRLLI
jgi:hypothetical protein